MNANELAGNSNYGFFTFLNDNAKKEDVMEGNQLTNEDRESGVIVEELQLHANGQDYLFTLIDSELIRNQVQAYE